MKKRILALILSVLMLASLAACSKGPSLAGTAASMKPGAQTDGEGPAATPAGLAFDASIIHPSERLSIIFLCFSLIFLCSRKTPLLSVFSPLREDAAQRQMKRARPRRKPVRPKEIALS